MSVLRGITWKNPRGYDPLVAASRIWMDENPSVTVVWEQWPWYEFEHRIFRSLESADGTYDLIMFDHPWVGKLASEGWLLPLDTLLESNCLCELRARAVTPSAESYEWQGHLWAIPLDAACHGALYRKDLIGDDRLPETWEELAGWAKARNNPPGRYGLILSVEGVLGHCLFLSMLAGLGHPAYLDEQNPTCDRKAAIMVLTLLKELLSFTPPGSSKLGPWDIHERFCRVDDVAYSPSIFPYVNYFSGGWRQSQMRVGLVPAFQPKGRRAAILGGVGLGIARTCKSVAEARRLACFLMSDKIQRRVFPENSGQPAAMCAWNDSVLNKSVNDFYHALAANMACAYVRPRYASFHALELEGGHHLQEWWDGEATLTQTLDRLHAR